MTHTKSEELFRRAVEKIPGGVNSQTRINTNTYVAFSCFIRVHPRLSVAVFLGGKFA